MTGISYDYPTYCNHMGYNMSLPHPKKDWVVNIFE